MNHRFEYTPGKRIMYVGNKLFAISIGPKFEKFVFYTLKSPFKFAALGAMISESLIGDANKQLIAYLNDDPRASTAHSLDDPREVTDMPVTAAHSLGDLLLMLIELDSQVSLDQLQQKPFNLNLWNNKNNYEVHDHKPAGLQV